MDDFIREGRREAEQERRRLSAPVPTRLPTAAYDWSGAIRGLPGRWLPTIRFREKKTHPAAWTARRAEVSAPVLPVDLRALADPGEEPPLPGPDHPPADGGAGRDRARGAGEPADVPDGATLVGRALEAPANHSWVISEMGYPSHPFSTCYAVLPVGSRIAGRRALFKVGDDDYITAERVPTSFVPTWAEAFRKHAAEIQMTPRGGAAGEEEVAPAGGLEAQLGAAPGIPVGVPTGGGEPWKEPEPSSDYAEARTLAVEYV